MRVAKSTLVMERGSQRRRVPLSSAGLFSQRPGARRVIDETRQLRWYLGLGLVFLAAAPLLTMTLLATDEAAPARAATALWVAAPVNLVGLAFVVRGMLADRPDASARLLKIGAAIVIVGTALLFGVRALTT